MRAIPFVLALIGAVVLALYLRATSSPDPVALQIGPTTTVISSPRTPEGGIDFNAAMGASEESEARLVALDAVLEGLGACATLEGERRAALITILREPLRMTRPASHITESSEQLVPKLITLLKSLHCHCSKEHASAIDDGNLLAAIAAYLSSSNQETFYLLHPLAVHTATECYRVGPADAVRVASAHFYDLTEHLELVRLGMLDEIVRRTANAHFDVNAALEAFNEDFVRALDGAPLTTTIEPKVEWLRSAAENRAAKSAFLGKTFSQQVPEIVAATRTAAENSASERRLWVGQ